MSIEIRMPKLSDNMEEGTLIRWIVSVGDVVAAGDPIAEVETDKADVEIEAESGGRISDLSVAEGATAPVGAVLAVLEEGAATTPAAGPATEERSEPAPEQAAAEPEPESTPPAREDVAASVPARPAAAVPTGIKASPVAQRIAADNGIDLATLRGSGPAGRIVKKDVEEVMAARAPVAAPVAAAAPAETVGAVDAPAMSRMRRTIASRMEAAKREIPHFYVRTQVDAGPLMDLHHALREQDVVPGLTVTHLLVRAIGRVMPQHPRLNAHWVDDSVQLVSSVNVGIVVALDDGLLVPVVKNVDQLGIGALVEQSRALIDRSRRGKFQADDLVGGTISVSNIGMLDIDELTPIINLPQAAILGVGAVRDVPVVRDGAVVPGRMMTLTLACDHRVVNGVEAGRFLEDLKASLEHPLALVVEGVA